MNCPNCGRPVTGKFCTGCGTRMPEDAGTATGSQTGGPAVSDSEATSRISQAELQAYIARASAQEGSNSQAAPQPGYGQAPVQEPYGQQSYGQQPGYGMPYGGPTTAIAVPPAPVTYGGGSSSPVSVTFNPPPANNKLYAVPLLGFLIKCVMVIPHVVVLYVLGLVIAVCQLFFWIPVLFTGQYPAFGFSLVGGTFRWGVRVGAFFFGLTDEYPPFGFGNEGDGYPVQVSFQPQETYSRFWAVPIVGYVVKYIILIPHLIVLYVLYLLVAVLQLGLWIPVLFGGKYPELGYSVVGGWQRWAVRVYAYFLGLTDQYPPFSMSN